MFRCSDGNWRFSGQDGGDDDIETDSVSMVPEGEATPIPAAVVVSSPKPGPMKFCAKLSILVLIMTIDEADDSMASEKIREQNKFK